MPNISWDEFIAPIGISLKVAITSSLVVFIVGVFVARMLARKAFPGKPVLETLFLLPLALPPSVVGFVLLVLLGRQGPFGRFAEWLFGLPLVFTWGAAVVAAIAVAFPLVYQSAKVGFLSVEKEVEEAARSDGAGERQVFLRITLPLAARSLISAYILGFARALGEFGATLMVAGSIPGKTQTLPTAIYVAVGAGHMTLSWWWAGSIIAISFLLLLGINRKIF